MKKKTYFVKGDRVERYNGFHATMKVGDIGTVKKTHHHKPYFTKIPSMLIELEEFPGLHNSKNLRHLCAIVI